MPRQIRITVINYTDEHYKKNRLQYYRNVPPCGELCGGFWTGHKDTFEQLSPLFQKELEYVLSNNLVSMEERILMTILENNEALFHPVYGYFNTHIKSHIINQNERS